MVLGRLMTRLRNKRVCFGSLRLAMHARKLGAALRRGGKYLTLAVNDQQISAAMMKDFDLTGIAFLRIGPANGHVFAVLCMTDKTVLAFEMRSAKLY